jgi:uncharacterized protein with FMN-binding domain
MRSKNAKPLIALALTGAGSALVVAFQVPEAPLVAVTSAASSTSTTAVVSHAAATATATATATRGATSRAVTTPTPEPTETATPTPTKTATSSSLYADGTYTGEAEQEPWGTFQVEVTISGGRVTDVSVVSAPTDGHSNRINTIAVPILTESVLSAQSTNVDLVSGATWTSDSYLTSLQAALDRAAAQNGN